MNGAGAAAAAAMSKHISQQSNSSKTTPRPSNVGGARANSLKTYSYNPKPSYQPITSLPRRYNSLTTKSQVHQQPILQPQPQLDFDDYIITTKTTKVVDSQGRTQSITTKTIKTLPDGSNIIETITKNISRSNSRSNSMRSNSLLSNSNQNINHINLSKIDEDLQDFDYNYMDENLHLNQGPINPQLSLAPNTPPPLQNFGHVQDNLNRHDASNNLSDHNHMNGNGNKIEHINSITSTTSSQKPLRSILKNTHKPKFHEDVPSSPNSSQYHPYLNLVKSSPINDNESITSSGLIKFNNNVETIEIESRKSNIDTPRKPQVLPQKQVEPPKNATMPDADFYAAAMQAAYKKVYGDRDPSQQPPIPDKSNSSPKLLSKHFIPSKKDKVTQAVASSDEQGITDKNYNYENHHKSFIGHSLRDKEIPTGSKHQDRVKQEAQAKKQSLKEELKAEKKAEKKAKKEAELLEKQARKEAKLAENERRKLQRSNKKFSGFFIRRKSVESQNQSIPTVSTYEDVSKPHEIDEIKNQPFERHEGENKLEFEESKLQAPIALKEVPHLEEPIMNVPLQQPIHESKEFGATNLPVLNDHDPRTVANGTAKVDHSHKESKTSVDNKDFNIPEIEPKNTPVEQKLDKTNDLSGKNVSLEVEPEKSEKSYTMDPGSPTDLAKLLPDTRINHASQVVDSQTTRFAESTSVDSAEFVDTVSEPNLEMPPDSEIIGDKVELSSPVASDPAGSNHSKQVKAGKFGQPGHTTLDAGNLVKEDVKAALVDSGPSEDQPPTQVIDREYSEGTFSVFHDASSHQLYSPAFSNSGLIKSEEFDKIIADSEDFAIDNTEKAYADADKPAKSEIVPKIDKDVPPTSNGKNSIEAIFQPNNSNGDSSAMKSKPNRSYLVPRSEVPKIPPPNLPNETGKADLLPEKDSSNVKKDKKDVPIIIARDSNVDSNNDSIIPNVDSTDRSQKLANNNNDSAIKDIPINESGKSEVTSESSRSKLPPQLDPLVTVNESQTKKLDSSSDPSKENVEVIPQSEVEEGQVEYLNKSEPIVETKKGKPKVKKTNKFKAAVLKYFVSSYQN